MDKLTIALCRFVTARHALEKAQADFERVSRELQEVLDGSSALMTRAEEENVLRLLPSLKIPFTTKQVLKGLKIPSSTRRAGSVTAVLQKWREDRPLLRLEGGHHIINPAALAIGTRNN